MITSTRSRSLLPGGSRPHAPFGNNLYAWRVSAMYWLEGREWHEDDDDEVEGMSVRSNLRKDFFFFSDRHFDGKNTHMIAELSSR